LTRDSSVSVECMAIDRTAQKRTCYGRVLGYGAAAGRLSASRTRQSSRRGAAASCPACTGPSTAMASGRRFRAASAARSMPNASTCRGEPAPSASIAAQSSSAARRSSRTTPTSVSGVSASIRCRLIQPPVARPECDRGRGAPTVNWVRSCTSVGSPYTIRRNRQAPRVLFGEAFKAAVHAARWRAASVDVASLGEQVSSSPLPIAWPGHGRARSCARPGRGVGKPARRELSLRPSWAELRPKGRDHSELPADGRVAGRSNRYDPRSFNLTSPLLGNAARYPLAAASTSSSSTGSSPEPRPRPTHETARQPPATRAQRIDPTAR
jgi:hypothetical protein